MNCEWISVWDRLPEELETVIVFLRVNGKLRSFDLDFRYKGQWHNSSENDMVTVTHWMKMPEPPEELEEKKE